MDSWVIVVIFALVIWFLMKKMGGAKGVKQITTAQLEDELKTNKAAQYVDVRTPAEYKGGHIRQFNNIPLQQLHTKADKLSKDKEVILICQSGSRSNAASKQLKKLGFEKVTNVRGGMMSWKGSRV